MWKNMACERKMNCGKIENINRDLRWKLQQQKEKTELIAFRCKHDYQIPQPTA